MYELDKGHTSNAKNAAWVRWCRARKLNYGATVPDEMKIKSAAFENLVYDPVKERHKIDYWLRKVFFVSAARLDREARNNVKYAPLWDEEPLAKTRRT